MGERYTIYCLLYIYIYVFLPYLYLISLVSLAIMLPFFCILFRGTLICSFYHILQFFCIIFTFWHPSLFQRTWFMKHFFVLLISLSLSLQHIFSFLCQKRYRNVNFSFPTLSNVCDIWAILFFSFGRILECKPVLCTGAS